MAQKKKQAKVKGEATVDEKEKVVTEVENEKNVAEQQPEATNEGEKLTDSDEDNTEKTEETSDETQDGQEATEEVPGDIDPLEVAQQEAAQWKDKYMRLSAEFDNYRKRTLKEKTELIKVANEDLLKTILPVIDDFERGIETIDKSTDVDALREGVHLIYNKFADFLKQNGIKEIESKEKEFDLDLHEALTKIPAPSNDLKGKVVDVIEKGYTLNEKVIRFAKVVVGD